MTTSVQNDLTTRVGDIDDGVKACKDVGYQWKDLERGWLVLDNLHRAKGFDVPRLSWLVVAPDDGDEAQHGLRIPIVSRVPQYHLATLVPFGGQGWLTSACLVSQENGENEGLVLEGDLDQVGLVGSLDASYLEMMEVSKGVR